MTLDEHNSLIEKIRNCESIADAQETLLELSKDYAQMISTQEEINKKLEVATKERDTFRDVNNKLWLERSINTSNNTESTKDEFFNTNVNTNTEPVEKMSYDSLKWD